MEKEYRALNISPTCYRGQHGVCGGKVKCGCDVRQCDCTCHQGHILMRGKFLVLATICGGCISASSINDRLTRLDKDTDIAGSIIDGFICKEIVRPSMCGLANACMSRSMFAASSCKTANDSAARKDPADVQITNDNACKSDLALAETACKKMKDSHGNQGHTSSNQDGGNPGVSRDSGVPSDAGGRTEAHD